MKKLLMCSVVILAFGVTPALADHHGDGEGKRDGHKGKMFEKQDTNGDGVISKEEFMSVHEDRFNKMDADGNGEVSKEEAEAMHAKWREKMMEKRAAHKEKHDESSVEEK